MRESRALRSSFLSRSTSFSTFNRKLHKMVLAKLISVMYADKGWKRIQIDWAEWGGIYLFWDRSPSVVTVAACVWVENPSPGREQTSSHSAIRQWQRCARPRPACLRFCHLCCRSLSYRFREQQVKRAGLPLCLLVLYGMR